MNPLWYFAYGLSATLLILLVLAIGGGLVGLIWTLGRKIESHIAPGTSWARWLKWLCLRPAVFMLICLIAWPTIAAAAAMCTVPMGLVYDESAIRDRNAVHTGYRAGVSSYDMLRASDERVRSAKPSIPLCAASIFFWLVIAARTVCTERLGQAAAYVVAAGLVLTLVFVISSLPVAAVCQAVDQLQIWTAAP